MQTNNLKVNEQGHLMFGGADTVKLAAEYQTPLYVFDEQLFRSACRSYKQSIDRYYDANGMVLYASKAFSCKEVYRIVASEGLGTDVVSGGEFYTALKAGFDPEKVFFHGNNKSSEELKFAIENHIGYIVIDSFNEIEQIENIAAELNAQQKVMLRITPGIDAHTHNYIRTGQIDSKFGFLIEDGSALQAVKQVTKSPHLVYCGLHCHIGSQIFTAEPFADAAEVMANLILSIKNETGVDTKCLDLGGGFGIRYTEEDTPISYSKFMETVSVRLKAFCKTHNLSLPFVYIEPGRSIAGPAGITLYTVGNIKTVPNVRTYVSVDGGMADNPRYALYGAKYEALIANKANEPKNFVATVAGKCCESGDLIGENMPLQTPKTGDILAVLSTGAYNYSMAGNYNRLLRPAVVMVNDGKARLIVKRETYEDIVKNDL